MKSLMLLFMILLSVVQYGQETITISGIVISEDQAVSDAYVTIGTQGSITDPDGRFEFQYSSISIADTIVLNIAALGFRSQLFEYPTIQADLTNLKIELSLFPEISEETALKDIQNGKIQFLLSSGIAPVIYSSDAKFTKKYGVSFYEFGCEVVADKALRSYNQAVAGYLDQKFGKRWRKKVRPDVVGIK